MLVVIMALTGLNRASHNGSTCRSYTDHHSDNGDDFRKYDNVTAIVEVAIEFAVPFTLIQAPTYLM